MRAIITSGDGVPQFLRTLDGNATDKQTLREAVLAYTAQLQASGEATMQRHADRVWSTSRDRIKSYLLQGSYDPGTFVSWEKAMEEQDDIEYAVPREVTIEQRIVPLDDDELVATLSPTGGIYISLADLCRALGIEARP